MAEKEKKKPDPDVARAESLVEQIRDAIEDEVPEGAKERRRDYFEDVDEKSTGIAETVTRTGRATAGQLQALENMLAGVRKWIPGEQ